MSNLKFLGKTIERLVSRRLAQHVKTYNLLDPFQSAYRPHHSVETAMLRVTNDILQAMDKGMLTALILLDLSAAFDTVDHTLLLGRLQHYLRIEDSALRWCSSYFSNRPQRVCVGNSKSDPFILDYSVPQGSILGPQFFSIYLLPISEIVSKYNLFHHVYADDTQIYVSFKPKAAEVEVTFECLKNCIVELKAWMSKNFLRLNDDKTEFIVFGSPQQMKKCEDLQLNIGECHIHQVPNAKNLGIFLDSSMSMNRQISRITSTSIFHMRNIKRIRKYLSRDVTEQVVHAFVTSCLDFGNSLLHGIPKGSIQRLQLLQNAAARVITGTGKFEHITPVLQELHWLPIRYRSIFKILLITFKTLNGEGPEYLRELLIWYMPIRRLRSGDKLLLVEPRSARSWGDRSFSVAAPRLWNNLPLHIRSSKSTDVFKSALKTHLLSVAFGNV